MVAVVGYALSRPSSSGAAADASSRPPAAPPESGTAQTRYVAEPAGIFDRYEGGVSKITTAMPGDSVRVIASSHRWSVVLDSTGKRQGYIESKLLLPERPGPEAMAAYEKKQKQLAAQAEMDERQRAEAAQRAQRDAVAAALATEAAKWRYSSSRDEMTGRDMKMAMIESENTVDFSSPYDGAQHGRLIIRSHPSYGRDVLLSIEKGQILCPSYDDCTVRVRFDEGKPENWTAAGAADHSSTTVFIRNYSRFLQRMRSAKVVRIQIPVYREGQPAFEFRVGGYDHERYTRGH